MIRTRTVDRGAGGRHVELKVPAMNPEWDGYGNIVVRLTLSEARDIGRTMASAGGDEFTIGEPDPVDRGEDPVRWEAR